MMDGDDPLDAELQHLLKPLEQYPPRDADKAARGLRRFLEVARSSPPAWQPSHELPTRPARHFHPPLPTPRWFPFRRLGFRAFALIVFLSLLFFGGSVASTLAARASLPGDHLYPLKTALEEVRLSLSSNTAMQASMHVSFARTRLNEISSLVEKGRYDELDRAVGLFNQQIQQALSSMRQVATEDPDLAAQLLQSIQSALADYSALLAQLRSQVPASAAESIDKAIQGASGEVEAQGKLAPLPSSSPPQASSPSPITATPPPPTPEAARLLDLDIRKFQVSRRVDLDKGEAIRIRLELKKAPRQGAQGEATVVGVQNEAEVYRQSLPIEGGKTRYDFPPYLPAAPGKITWTVVLSDDDPDADEAVLLSQVSGAAPTATPTPSISVTPLSTPTLTTTPQSGGFDLDIQDFKAPSHLKMEQPKPIKPVLEVRNSGLLAGQGMAVLTGLQDGLQVYHQSLQISLTPGTSSAIHFPEFTPEKVGELLWLLTLSDDDPDEDQFQRITLIEP